MDIAPIAPITMLKQSAGYKYQLMLPHMLYDDQYRKHFADLCKTRRTYVILDNGIAEGVQFPTDQLIEIAVEFGVDEVVMPDVLFNPAGTIEATRAFAQQVLKSGVLKGAAGKRIKFGYVIQGRSIHDALTHCRVALNSDINAYAEVFYIPRALAAVTEDRIARATVANFLKQFDRKNRPIHLLGTWPAQPVEVWNAATWAAHIRSVDTSLPYVHALKYSTLSSISEDLQRDIATYFHVEMSPRQRELAIQNCVTLNRWAHGRRNGSRDGTQTPSGGVREVSPSGRRPSRSYGRTGSV